MAKKVGITGEIKTKQDFDLIIQQAETGDVFRLHPNVLDRTSLRIKPNIIRQGNRILINGAKKFEGLFDEWDYSSPVLGLRRHDDLFLANNTEILHSGPCRRWRATAISSGARLIPGISIQVNNKLLFSHFDHESSPKQEVVAEWLNGEEWFPRPNGWVVEQHNGQRLFVAYRA